jgi:hypothetical protein
MHKDLIPVMQEVILYSIAKDSSLWPMLLIEGSLPWEKEAGV